MALTGIQIAAITVGVVVLALHVYACWRLNGFWIFQGSSVLGLSIEWNGLTATTQYISINFNGTVDPKDSPKVNAGIPLFGRINIGGAAASYNIFTNKLTMSAGGVNVVLLKYTPPRVITDGDKLVW